MQCLLCASSPLTFPLFLHNRVLGSKLFPCIFLIGCADVPRWEEKTQHSFFFSPLPLLSTLYLQMLLGGNVRLILCTKLSVKAFLSILLKGELFLFPKGFISPSEVPFFLLSGDSKHGTTTPMKRKLLCLYDVGHTTTPPPPFSLFLYNTIQTNISPQTIPRLLVLSERIQKELTVLSPLYPPFLLVSLFVFSVLSCAFPLYAASCLLVGFFLF
jgi:hypothetical protein